MNTVSVITVCFNADPAKIRVTTESILRQDYPSVEFIVIDGGSVDQTLEAFEKYRDRIDHFASEPDRGIFEATNKGVAAARGEWISFMNVGDTFVTETALSDLVNPSTTAADIVYGDPIRAAGGRARSPRSITKYVLYHDGICHQALVARRSLFLNIGGFDDSLKLGGDPEWLLRAYRSGATFMYVPTVVCRYEGGGASADYRERKYFRSKVTKRHFSPAERLVYGTMLLFEKFAMRFATLNFRIPVAVADWLDRPR